MHSSIPALVFGPGLAPGGVPGTLSISALGLEVHAGERAQRVPIADVKLREVGFEKIGLELAWNDASDVWAAHVLDPVAARSLLNSSGLAATPQALALHRQRRGRRTTHSIGMTVLAILLALPVIILLLLIANADRLAGWIADRIPVAQEAEWGRQAFAQMRGTLKVVEGGPSQSVVAELGSRLTSRSQFQYEFYVADDDTLNAFALPGGVVVVNTGLIATTKRPEELAGVLAHEVQHVELRHSLRGAIKQLGLRGLWGFVSGDLGGTLAGQAALQMTTLKFSRDAEREADAHGFDSLVAAGIDPSGMPDFFKTMSEKVGDLPAAFLSTHPLSREREAALEKRAAALDQRFAPLALGNWPPQ